MNDHDRMMAEKTDQLLELCRESGRLEERGLVIAYLTSRMSRTADPHARTVLSVLVDEFSRNGHRS